MQIHTGVRQGIAPLSQLLLILGGEISVLCNGAAVLLFAFAGRLPQPAAAYVLADQMAGMALRAALLAVLIAFAHDLASRLLSKRRG